MYCSCDQTMLSSVWSRTSDLVGAGFIFSEECVATNLISKSRSVFY